MKVVQKEENQKPESYKEEELYALEAHIEKNFGVFGEVFHEIASPDIHVDIAIIEPTPECNYYTLVTIGMGAHLMNIPENLRGRDLERAELLTFLPSDWEFSNGEEVWYWPLRWLKFLARLPLAENSWLSWGHTVTNGRPFADNTKLSEVLLVSPWVEHGEEAATCTLPNGEKVNFFQMIPIYSEELSFKQAHGTEALLNLFGEDFLPVLDPKRKNYGIE